MWSLPPVSRCRRWLFGENVLDTLIKGLETGKLPRWKVWLLALTWLLAAFLLGWAGILLLVVLS